MFRVIFVSVCTLMHIYVVFRSTQAQIPFTDKVLPFKPTIAAGVILWIFLAMGSSFGRDGKGFFAIISEFMGMNWLGALFLLFVSFLAVDVITVFGFLMPKLTPSIRGAAFILGLALSMIGLFQGLRSPLIEKYEVIMPDLPKSMDGTILAVMTDTHLGALIGENWLKARIAQVNAAKPDLVALVGDIFEGHGEDEKKFLNMFDGLTAPMGIWYVLGNHEFYGGGDLNRFKNGSLRLLRDEWVEASPGLVIAGVDDLTVRRRLEGAGDSVSKTLKNRPEGATILLSHTPWLVESAAREKVGLMLSGHTHAGQIWPFTYLVKRRYPYLEGRYDTGGMTLIVCRGTGTWGPRMRLWKPGAILMITLRAEA